MLQKMKGEKNMAKTTVSKPWYNNLSVKNIRWISFVLGFVLFLLFLYVSNTTEFYNDTDNYWRTSDEFIIDGKFNLNPMAVETPTEYARWTFSYKGIVFPLLLLVARGGGLAGSFIGQPFPFFIP